MEGVAHLPKEKGFVFAPLKLTGQRRRGVLWRRCRRSHVTPMQCDSPLVSGNKTQTRGESPLGYRLLLLK